MADDTAPEAPPFLEDTSVREVYVDAVQVVVLNGASGVMRFELCAQRWTQRPPIHADRQIPVARFAMTLNMARVLRDQIQLCLDGVERQSQLAQLPAASAVKN